MHGNGEYRWPDGTMYTGEMWRNFIQGVGVLKYSNGNKYIGLFHRDKANGDEGKFYWKEGKKYKGQWESGIMHGRGVMQLVDRAVYHGDF